MEPLGLGAAGPVPVLALPFNCAVKAGLDLRHQALVQVAAGCERGIPRNPVALDAKVDGGDAVVCDLNPHIKAAAVAAVDADRRCVEIPVTVAGRRVRRVVARALKSVHVFVPMSVVSAI